MVEVGQIEIIGSMNDTEIDQGFRRVVGNFKDVENQANQANVSMGSFDRTVTSIGKKLIGIGSIGLAAITGLATKSPALAGTFAKMEVATLKLSNTLGKQLRPVFEGINGFLQDFNIALLNNQGTITDFSSKIGEGFGDLGSAINGEWSKINNLIPKGSGVAAGIAMGSKFGLQGMLLGAALGYIGGDALVTESTAENEKFGVFAESMTSADNTLDVFQERNKVIANPNSSSWDMAKADLSVLSSAFSTGSNAIFDFFQWLFGDASSKERNMSSANGVPR